MIIHNLGLCPRKSLLCLPSFTHYGQQTSFHEGSGRVGQYHLSALSGQGRAEDLLRLVPRPRQSYPDRGGEVSDVLEAPSTGPLRSGLEDPQPAAVWPRRLLLSGENFTIVLSLGVPAAFLTKSEVESWKRRTFVPLSSSPMLERHEDFEDVRFEMKFYARGVNIFGGSWFCICVFSFHLESTFPPYSSFWSLMCSLHMWWTVRHSSGN